MRSRVVVIRPFCVRSRRGLERGDLELDGRAHGGGDGRRLPQLALAPRRPVLLNGLVVLYNVWMCDALEDVDLLHWVLLLFLAELIEVNLLHSKVERSFPFGFGKSTQE